MKLVLETDQKIKSLNIVFGDDGDTGVEVNTQPGSQSPSQPVTYGNPADELPTFEEVKAASSPASSALAELDIPSTEERSEEIDPDFAEFTNGSDNA